jgi:hypothetical protein
MKVGARFASAVMFAALATGLVPWGSDATIPEAQAQNFGQRVVVGSVFDDASAPVSGADCVSAQHQVQIDSQLYVNQGWALPIYPGGHVDGLRPVGRERRQEERREGP